MAQGSNFTVGEALVKHPAIKAVGFTGSFRGGKALFDMAAARPEPIPVYAEMAAPIRCSFIGSNGGTHHSNRHGSGSSVTLGVGQFAPIPDWCWVCRTPNSMFFLNLPQPRFPGNRRERCCIAASNPRTNRASKQSARSKMCACWPTAAVAITIVTACRDCSARAEKRLSTIRDWKRKCSVRRPF
ncbi:MAG: hypothetical protein R3C26_02650 [Calditrichia bacterium]